MEREYKIAKYKGRYFPLIRYIQKLVIGVNWSITHYSLIYRDVNRELNKAKYSTIRTYGTLKEQLDNASYSDSYASEEGAKKIIREYEAQEQDKEKEKEEHRKAQVELIDVRQPI